MKVIEQTSTRLLLEDMGIYKDIEDLGLLTNKDKLDRSKTKKELERRSNLQYKVIS